MDKEGKLILDSNKKKSFAISETIYFKELYKEFGKEYKDVIDDKKGNKIAAKPQDNQLDEIFILRANDVKKKDEEALFERVIREGVYINNIQYVHAEKSSSMTRTQKTVFIKTDLKERMTDRITLGKQPDECVTAKLLTTKGYLLSSVDIVDIKPRICIIPDFERVIPGEVYQIEDYTLDPSNEEAIKYQAEMDFEKARKKEYDEKLKEANEKLTQMELENLILSKLHSRKSKSQWINEGKRVKPECLLEPVAYKVYNGKNYPVYDEEQTEEIKVFPLKPYTIGKDKVYHNYKETDENCPKINCFDGQGLGSFEFFKKVQDKMEVKHFFNSIQLRMPYIKSNVVKIDFKAWFKEHNITHITDLFNNDVAVDDIDIIMTESCFKAKLEKTEGKNPWLFKSINEYNKLLDKYCYDYIGITNYSHPYNPNEYTTMTYQFINSTELGYVDLHKLIKNVSAIMEKARKGDIASIKLVLDMIAKPENDEYEETQGDNLSQIISGYESDQAKVIRDAIELNEQLIYDKHIQNYISQRIKNIWEGIAIGKIPVQSSFVVATGDVIAFMEWVAYREKDKVKGFLKADQFYCNGINKEMIMTRYPLCHFSEIKLARFVHKFNKYTQHLNNIIQFNIYDLTMVRLNEDFDGDKNYIIDASIQLREASGIYEKCEHEYLKDAIIEDFPIYNPDDKTTAPASKFDTDAIVKFELHNLNSATGQVTNLNTVYQTKAHEEGSLFKRDLESAICKDLQGKIIDSVKLQTEITVPELLIVYALKKPYFMQHIYGGNRDDYMQPKSTLDEICEAVEKKLKYKKIRVSELDELTEIVDGKEKKVITKGDIKVSNSEIYVGSKYITTAQIPDGEYKVRYSDGKHYRSTGTNEKEDFTFEIEGVNPYHLLIDDSKYNSKIEIELMKKLIPIFNEYSTEKGKIYQKSRNINRLSSIDEDKEALKNIKNEYHELYKNTREKCKQIFNDITDIDQSCRESILASLATKIEYNYAKTTNENGVQRNKAYNFPWIVSPIGLLQNIKAHEDINKTMIIPFPELDKLSAAFNGIIKVKENVAYLKDNLKIYTYLNDGKYPVQYNQGNHYIIQDAQEEKSIKLPESNTPLFNENIINPLKDFETKIIKLDKSGFDLKEKIDNKFLILRSKNDMGELALYDAEDEYLGTIRREDYEKIEKGIILNDYVNKYFTAKVKDITKTGKSIEIVLNMVC
jgi:hypothetical protein